MSLLEVFVTSFNSPSPQQQTTTTPSAPFHWLTDFINTTAQTLKLDRKQSNHSTMKFSSVTVIAALSAINDASAFAPHSRLAVTHRISSNAGSLRMSLDDLESKLLTDPAPRGRGKPAPKPAPKKVEAAAAPAPPTPAPTKKERPQKVKYVDLGDVPAPAPAPKAAPVKVEKPKPVKVEKSKPVEVEKPKPVVVKAEKPKPAPKKAAPVVVPVPSPPAPKAVVTAEKDSNASLGLALGAAPLIIAPVALLAGARGALSKTQARRAEIQKQIEEKEAAKKKAEKQADVDGGGVASALVSN